MSNNKRVYLYYYKLRRIETFIATSVKEDYVFIAGIRYSRKSSSAIIFDDKGKLIEYLDNKYEKEIDDTNHKHSKIIGSKRHTTFGRETEETP